jgi:hypothetical protein
VDLSQPPPGARPRKRLGSWLCTAPIPQRPVRQAIITFPAIITSRYPPLPLPLPLPEPLPQAFGRLERAEVGGTKGRALTAAARALHSDFAAALSRFQALEYDPLDLGEPRFQDDHGAFRWACHGLERRLAAIVTQARARWLPLWLPRGRCPGALAERFSRAR